MTATPDDIARYTSDGVLITVKDPAIKDRDPSADDMKDKERPLFFDDADHGQILTDELFAFLAAEEKPHEAVETADTLGLGIAVPVFPKAPQLQIVDATRGLNARTAIRSYSFDMSSDTYAVELVGIPAGVMADQVTFDSTEVTMDDVVTQWGPRWPNLLSNPDFAGGLDNWNLVTAHPELHFFGLDGAEFVYPGEHYLGALSTVRDGSLDAAVVSEWIGIEPGDDVRITAWIASRECVAKLRLQWGDTASNYLPPDAVDSATVFNDFRGSATPAGWRHVGCEATAPAGAQYARLVLIKGGYIDNPDNDDLSWAFMRQPRLEVVPVF